MLTLTVVFLYLKLPNGMNFVLDKFNDSLLVRGSFGILYTSMEAISEEGHR